jgi:hypothetical protein
MVCRVGELVQEIGQGDTTMHHRIMFRWDYYFDLSLHGDELAIRTRLAQPDKLGRIEKKPDFELAVRVLAEDPPLASGFVIRRGYTLQLPVDGERVEHDSRYRDDVNYCYFLKTVHEIEKGTQQPPWMDPSDPFWRRRLGQELMDRGRLPSAYGSVHGEALMHRDEPTPSGPLPHPETNDSLKGPRRGVRKPPGRGRKRE